MFFYVLHGSNQKNIPGDKSMQVRFIDCVALRSK